MKFRNFRNEQIFRPKKLSKIVRVTGGPEQDFANLIENEPNMNLTRGVKNYKFATLLQDVADVFA